MIHFIRNADNTTIADCDATPDDLHCVVDVGAFSRLLLAARGDEQEDLIATFSNVQEIRRLYFEGWHDSEHGWIRPADIDDPAYTPDNLAKRLFEEVARRFGLAYVTD